MPGGNLKVGFLTIGQSPRKETTDDLPDSLKFLKIEEAGALDDLSAEQIASLRPKKNETVYVTQLRNGSEVTVAREQLLPLLQAKVALLLQKGVKLILLLCSGEFDLEGRDRILFPSEILKSAVSSLTAGKGRLGVLVPDDRQIEDATAAWSEFADEVKVLSVSPYLDSDEALRNAAKALSGCDLIVMDCMGYSRHHRKIVRKASGRSVMAARTISFRFLEELLS